MRRVLLSYKVGAFNMVADYLLPYEQARFARHIAELTREGVQFTITYRKGE